MEAFHSNPTHGLPLYSPHSVLASPFAKSADPGWQHPYTVRYFSFPQLQNFTMTLCHHWQQRERLQNNRHFSLSVLETRSPKSKQWQGDAPSEGCRGGSVCLFPRVCGLLATLDFPYLNICIILISTNVFIWRSPVCVFLHLCVQISLSLLRHQLLD